MRTKSSLLAAVAVSIAVLASGSAVADTTWTFTKSPTPFTRYAISTTPGVDAMVFIVTAPAGLGSLTRMAFMVTGTVRAADVANFQLVYHPDGISGTGVVVGSSSGAGLTQTTAIVSFDLAAPLALPADITGLSTGVFALRVDVNGARSFSFQPQLQTVAVESGGVQKYLLAETEDLPLAGDSFHVN